MPVGTDLTAIPVEAPDPAGHDKGLVRAVGTIPFAASIVNCVVGAGIFSLPAAMAMMAGHLAPAAFLLCAVAMGAVVLCCAEASGRVATSGGCAGYAQAAFGPLAGFVTGVLVWTSAVVACGGIMAALADGLATWFPSLLQLFPRFIFIVVVIGGISAINVAGVSPATRVITLLTILKLAPLLLLVIGGGLWILAHPMTVAAASQPANQFGQAMILALFAFSGMETPLSASGEVVNPARTIPRALFLSMGVVTALYIGIQIVCDSLLGSRLAQSSTPLGDAMAVVSPALGVVLLLAASFSRFGWISSHMLGAPRNLFAFAREGTLPRWLAAVHSRTHAPYAAIWTNAAVAILLANTGTFEQLAIMSGLASAGIYFMACSAAWALHRRGVTGGGDAPRYPLLPYAALLAMIAMVTIVALGEPRDIAGLAMLIIVSVAWFFVAQRVKGRSVRATF